MKRALLFFLMVSLLSADSFAQRNCGTTVYNNTVLKVYPMLEGRYGITNNDRLIRQKLNALKGTINIPISFHVIWNTQEENLSDSLLYAQVEQLNRDYSAKAVEMSGLPPYFNPDTVDCGFHFFISKITRIHTNKTFFLMKQRIGDGDDPLSDPIKFTDQGGENGDASTQFLNVWTGNITDGSPPSNQLLGYGTFPGGIGKYDGIVVYYQAIGPNTSYAPFERGRTLTHELGHWLNLRHIWGDQPCGDDLVVDTPQQEQANSGMPDFPHLSSCSRLPGGDMFMNFMDYTADDGMYMFTRGQRDRMRSLFVEGGPRASFMHNVLINDMALADLSVRNDQRTPIISYVRDKLSNARKIISWKADPKIKQYLVEFRQLGSSAWIKQKTTANSATLPALKANSLFEVRLQSINGNGETSAKSVPYIFKSAGISATKKTTK